MTQPISIAIAESAAEAAIAGSLSGAGSMGLEMHVALVRDRGRSRGQRRTVTAPAPAWDAFLSWAHREARVAPGTSKITQERARRLQVAGERVGSELLRLAQHPAYRNEAVRGRSPIALPAYRNGGGRFWPTPGLALANGSGDRAWQEGSLEPKVIHQGGAVFTSWEFSPPGS